MVQERHLEAADNLRNQHDKAIQNIAGRTHLTDDAKLKLMARVYTDAKEQMTELQRTAMEDTASKKASIEQSVFGIKGLPGDPAMSATSFRDAQDRAARISNPGDAAALLARAERSGDEPLARAVAGHAYDMGNSPLGRMTPGWGEVLDTYLSARPEKAGKVQQLDDLKSPRTARTMFAFVLPQPSELSNLSSTQLREYADAASSIG